MADPFSIAAGYIGLAATGAEFATSLYEYAKSIREAEKMLKPIAAHTTRLYTTKLLESTKNALDGCKTAFDNLEKFVTASFVKNESGKLSLASKAMFSFRQKELDVLQAHLERFKSSLNLILGVLHLAFSTKTAKDNAALLEMKVDIQGLMIAERKMKLKESQLTAESQSQAAPQTDGTPDFANGIDTAAVANLLEADSNVPAPRHVQEDASSQRNVTQNIGNTTPPVLSTASELSLPRIDEDGPAAVVDPPGNNKTGSASRDIQEDATSPHSATRSIGNALLLRCQPPAKRYHWASTRKLSCYTI
ncbi:uncharacterized protein LTR77_006977 [Saxophila tyrrhenica]|uniref:Fungal N-terminal domain-containing protein n=1 Tax=Saxophila tyrrhenica TaxID=1690608 RepID=A0AAV9P6G9_9PEZI|nr:hypothetical protein LTR77_006977 [Saxophila tyrrhenica]